MIRFESVDLSVVGTPLLNDIHWHLTPNTRVGLVGRNGAGKTTLLRAMMQELTPDSGTLHFRKNASIAWLPQHAVSGSTDTVWQEVEAGMTKLNALRSQLEAAEKAVQSGDQSAISPDWVGPPRRSGRPAGSSARRDFIGGVLSGLGFSDGATGSGPCTDFSGGWQMRIALARSCSCPIPTSPCWTSRRTTWIVHARQLARGPPDELAVGSSVGRSSATIGTCWTGWPSKIVEVRKGRVTEWVGNFSDYVRQSAHGPGDPGGHPREAAEGDRQARAVRRAVRRQGDQGGTGPVASRRRSIGSTEWTRPDSDRALTPGLRLPEPAEGGFTVDPAGRGRHRLGRRR